MQKFISLFLVFILAIGFVMHDAAAKRFGGGRSFGTYRSASSFTSQRSFATPQSGIATKKNSWLAPLAGLTAGALLGSLFMNHGLGSGLLTLFMVFGIGMLIMSLFRRKMQTAAANHYFRNMHEDIVRETPSYLNPSSANSVDATQLPASFDATTFIRDAKVKFVRLQAAYDQKNVNDIRKFTTPEVLAEIMMQLQERGDADNQTDVVSLDAEVLGVSEETNADMIASVRFNGMIREEKDKSAVPFNEIWHFQRDTNSMTWLVSGIQQAH